MTTYNPPPQLLSRQIASIKAQTYQNWVCLISDDHSEPPTVTLIQHLVAGDARFRLYFRPDRAGFYRNFERCLEQVPDDAHLIALADHDDYWHPDKLEKLIAALKPEDTLVFSDMNIVDEQQNLISSTYWTTRRNNHERLDWLIVANTVTGASAMFRRHAPSSPAKPTCAGACPALAGGGLLVHRAPGDHESYSRKYVQETAEQLRICLEQSIPGTGSS